MTVAFQRMFGILDRWNYNQVTPSLSKPHELSYRSNISGLSLLQSSYWRIGIDNFTLIDIKIASHISER